MAPRTTTRTSITGYGVWHPPTVLGNEELCVAFNEFVRRENLKNADAILRQSLVSHVISSKHAAPLMIRAHRGLIVEVIENDVLGGAATLSARP